MRLDMNIFQIAAKYAANLMGIATPEEREALENWKQESVWHTNLAERLDQEEDFKENQQLLERFSVTEAWKKMEKNLDKAMGRRAGGRRWWKYAAVILVMLGGGFWYFQMKTAVPVKPPLIVQQSIPSGKRSAKLTLGNGKVVKLVPDGRFTLAEMDGTVIQKDSTGIDYRQIGVGEDTLVYNQMETLTGMEYTLTLSDGTRVYLNAESRLKYPVVFRGTERVVELSGEAYFKVSKDALRPFVVKMNGVNVRVLGTSFYEEELKKERAGGENAYAVMAREAAEVEAGSEGLIILPYIYGERSPIQDAKASGMLFGLKGTHTRKQINRAALEAVGYSTLQHMILFDEMNLPPKSVITAGGGTKNAAWMQIICDMIGRQICIPKRYQCSAYGDAAMAALGDRRFRDFTELRDSLPKGKILVPNEKNHIYYKEHYKMFRDLYLNNKDMMHRI